MRILRLQAENVKRLKAVDISPTGPVVAIGGRNGQGKTSVIDAIVYLLGGVVEQCAEPVRRGEKAMRIVGHLDDLVVTRMAKAGGGGSLVITSADGKSTFSSPQTMLDQFVGRLAFDPLEFLRMKPAQQRELLRSLVGLDFSGLDANRKALFDARANAGRDVHGREQQIDNLQHFPDAPAEEVSVANLSALLSEAHRVLRENDASRARAKKAETDAEWAQQHAGDVEADVAKVREQGRLAVEAARRRVEEASRALADAEEQAKYAVREAVGLTDKAKHAAKVARKAAEAAQESTAGLVDPDIAEIQRKIGAAESINGQVAANRVRQSLQTQFDEAKTEYDRLDAEIEDIDAEKEKQLAAAAFPIDGLSFSESGVSFNGLPFDQASSAEQLRVSVAMGLALNPQLKLVLIRDGSLLDQDSRRMVEEMVEKAGGQAWLEVVTTDPAKASVIIEDGAVQTPGGCSEGASAAHPQRIRSASA